MVAKKITWDVCDLNGNIYGKSKMMGKYCLIFMKIRLDFSQ